MKTINKFKNWSSRGRRPRDPDGDSSGSFTSFRTLRMTSRRLRMTFFNAPLAGLLCVTAVLAACGTLHDKRVMARVGEEVILEDEVNSRIPMGAFKDNDKLLQLQKKEMTQLIIEKLLKKESKQQDITISELLSKNVYQKIKPVHKKDAKKYFEKNKDRFKKITFEDAHKLIEDLIYRERKRDALAVYYNHLIKKGGVHIFREKG